MISSIKDKLNNINYDVTTGNRNAGVMILLSEIIVDSKTALSIVVLAPI